MAELLKKARFLFISERKSSHYGLDILGYTRATKLNTEGCD